MSETDPSAVDFHPAAELYDIVRGLRACLLRHQRAGVWAVPAAESPRPDDVDWRHDLAAPRARRAAAAPGARPGSGPRESGPGPAPERDAPTRAELPPQAPQPEGWSTPVEFHRDHSQEIEEATGFSSMSAALAHALGEAKPKAAPATSPPRQDSSPDVPLPAPTTTPAPPSAGSSPPSLATVRADLGDCQRCKLAPTRTHIVFGVGHQDADLMFIGEAPGEQEDLRGEPFVGAAGQLLDKMIAAMGWTRDTVYIANVLKCRPPGNRDPAPDEVAACRPFLERQIAAVQPRLIVTLGKPAAHLVLESREPIGRLRGRFHGYRGIPVMPTYHPSYLLRSPAQKRLAWDDLKQVIAELERMGVDSPHRPQG